MLVKLTDKYINPEHVTALRDVSACSPSTAIHLLCTHVIYVDIDMDTVASLLAHAHALNHQTYGANWATHWDHNYANKEGGTASS